MPQVTARQVWLIRELLRNSHRIATVAEIMDISRDTVLYVSGHRDSEQLTRKQACLVRALLAPFSYPKDVAEAMGLPQIVVHAVMWHSTNLSDKETARCASLLGDNDSLPELLRTMQPQIELEL
jgi:hypothetical protein